MRINVVLGLTKFVPINGSSLPFLTRLTLRTFPVLAVSPADALKIANIGQSSIFRLQEQPFGGTVQHFQLLPKNTSSLLGQRLNQVFQHGPQTPGNLDA